MNIKHHNICNFIQYKIPNIKFQINKIIQFYYLFTYQSFLRKILFPVK